MTSQTSKDSLRVQLKQAVSSLAKAIDANYPNQAEYKAKLRAAGFQREKYRQTGCWIETPRGGS